MSAYCYRYLAERSQAEPSGANRHLASGACRAYVIKGTLRATDAAKKPVTMTQITHTVSALGALYMRLHTAVTNPSVVLCTTPLHPHLLSKHLSQHLKWWLLSKHRCR